MYLCVCGSSDSYKKKKHFRLFIFSEHLQVCLNQLRVITHVFTSSCVLLRVTPFQKIHLVKCCVTLLYLRRDGEATATTEINPV